MAPLASELADEVEGEVGGIFHRYKPWGSWLTLSCKLATKMLAALNGRFAAVPFSAVALQTSLRHIFAHTVFVFGDAQRCKNGRFRPENIIKLIAIKSIYKSDKRQKIYQNIN